MCALDPKTNIKDFYFNVIRGDGSPANGAEITVIDPITQRKELTYKGNEKCFDESHQQNG